MQTACCLVSSTSRPQTDKRPTCCHGPHPELHGVDEPSTFVALVAAGLRVAAEGTRALHEAVSQEALTVFTAQLLHHVLHQETVLVETPEDVLGYSAGRTEHRSPQGELMCTMNTWYKADLVKTRSLCMDFFTAFPGKFTMLRFSSSGGSNSSLCDSAAPQRHTTFIR